MVNRTTESIADIKAKREAKKAETDFFERTPVWLDTIPYLLAQLEQANAEIERLKAECRKCAGYGLMITPPQGE